MQTGVTEALNRNARAFDLAIERLQRLIDDEETATRRRFVATERSADRNGLARHHAWNRKAVLHRVRIHDPRHDLRSRVDVRCGYVFLGADDDRDFRREA